MIVGGMMTDHIQILVDAVSESARHYKSLGDYSATQLIDAPRIVALRKRYGHLTEPTLEQQIAAFIGTGIHAHFERNLKAVNAKHPDYMLERSLSVPVFLSEEDKEYRMISGTFDILHKEKDVYDIKTVNVWKKVFDPNMVDWHNQQNIYAWLLKQRGVDVESINVIAIYKDWTKNNAIRNREYPQSQVCHYKLKLWNFHDTERYIMSRLLKHVACENADDKQLPECAPEERWEREGTKYAIMKNDRAKRAMKVCSTLGEAAKAVHHLKVTSDSFVEVRPAKRTRCEAWCSINKYCNTWLEYQQRLENTDNWLIPVSQLGR
jgi:hypothetical protein